MSVETVCRAPPHPEATFAFARLVNRLVGGLDCR
ncbi:hypothetical protein ACVILE_003356 [Streptomyces sp. M18.1]